MRAGGSSPAVLGRKERAGTTDKITGGQWAVLEHLAAAERAGETVRQTWLPVGGPWTSGRCGRWSG
ncbi:hypothetical protein [Streptomyces sp. DH37]|uniref:hypothetical protein n=1 Tax=Streptomyces sp. DH37 TaxID=3040122 RepID=UPI00244238E2|nr:hypothetical protein [Streptomyces sp. DH37]MDG9703864.1 hypothetical protein [Streptomyces sp. DH37]